MFLMTMPKTFKIGDTAECPINGEPARITWRSRSVLVIEPDDARDILRVDTDDRRDLLDFVCGDPGLTTDDYVQEGAIIRQKLP
jgi:hypothetical protein